MVDLYLGNPTPQRHMVHYYMAERSDPIPIIIDPRHQTMVKFNSDVELDQFLKSYERYGLKAASEIDRLESYTYLVYSTGKAITGSRLTYAAQHNHAKLEKQGEANRATLAIAAANSYETATKGINATSETFSLDIKEVPADGSEGFHEKLDLVQEGADQNRESQSAPRRRGRPRKNTA